MSEYLTMQGKLHVLISVNMLCG